MECTVLGAYLGRFEPFDAFEPTVRDAGVACIGGEASALLRVVARMKEKDALKEVRKVLLEAAAQRKINLQLKPKMGKVTYEQLQSYINAFHVCIRVMHFTKSMHSAISVTSPKCTSSKAPHSHNYTANYCMWFTWVSDRSRSGVSLSAVFNDLFNLLS